MRAPIFLITLATALSGLVAYAQPQDPVGDLIQQVTALTANQAPTPQGSAFGLKATLYVTTNRDSGKDSIGCRVIPMRTAAVDGRIVTRHTILFIKETVGMLMPDGHRHDGYWYATDVGSAIHPGRIDLYTGKGFGSIAPLLPLNLKMLTVRRAGRFAGCPDRNGAPTLLAAAQQRPLEVGIAAPATTLVGWATTSLSRPMVGF